MIAFGGLGVLVIAACLLASCLLRRRFPHLLTAALLIGVVGFAHSILGELALIGPLGHVRDLPTPRGSVQATWLVIRVTWHAPTLLWLGIAGVLIWMETHPESASRPFLWMVVTVFVLSALVSVLTSPLSHVAWAYFLAIAILCLMRLTPFDGRHAATTTGPVPSSSA